MIQTEEFNKPLLYKYILHILITLFSHIFIFFYVSIVGNKNMNNSPYCLKESANCNDFGHNSTTVFFYILYIVYLVCSGLQVKYGFYDMKRKSILKAGNSSINGIIYKVYKAVPFFYEIKHAIDWTATATAMDLFEYFKFESVYDILFTTYCDMTAKGKRPVGTPVTTAKKGLMGGLLSTALILLLVLPLLLFSSLNPTNQNNNVTNGRIMMQFSFRLQGELYKNYTFYQNDIVESILPITANEKEFSENGFDKNMESKNYKKDRVQIVKFPSNSDTNWALTKPARDDLIEKFDIDYYTNETNKIEAISIYFLYQFERPMPANAQICKKDFNFYLYGTEIKKKETRKEDTPEEKARKLLILQNLHSCLSQCREQNFTFPKFYTTGLKLGAEEHAKRIFDKEVNPYVDVDISFKGCRNITDSSGTIKNYVESYFQLRRTKTQDGITFHTFSEQISGTTQGLSILAFYTTFILVVGNYVRNFLAGNPEKIMLTEMPEPEDLVNLCEGIKISRYSFDFSQEEYLYYVLIELMRSPDYLKLLTESSLTHLKKRRERMEQNKLIY